MSFPYTITYSKRKTLALGVNRDASVFVRSPKGVSLKRIEDFVREKRDWILRAIEWMQTANMEVSVPFVLGKPLRYFGMDYMLDFSEECFDGLRIEDGRMVLSIWSSDRAKEVIREWYEQKAWELLPDRAWRYAEIMELSYNRVKISNARTNWGSCTIRNDILFNWRLLQFSMEVIDYVVIHELAHLRQRNHSAKFWDIVARHCPDYKAMRRVLKDRTLNILR